MPFKHKLSRRLATLFSLVTAATIAACAAPTTGATTEENPTRPSTLDPALAITTSTTVGSRIITDRHVQVFAQASRRSSVIGVQKNNVYGTIVEGPSATSLNEPYPLFRINFDSGTDGWVLAAYMSLVSAPPPPPPAPAPAPVASISVSPATATIAIGSSAQLTATVRDSAGNVLTGRTITWATSNSANAIVSASGSVTALASGSATITATSEGRSATAAITVPAPAPASVATVTVSPATATLTVLSGQQLGATLRDAAGNVLTGRTVTWSSSSTAIATVSTTGYVLGALAGTVTITATSEGRTGTAAITVQAAAPPPPPATGGILFQSRWTTELGRTSAAFLDSNNPTPFIFACCNGATNTSIVTAASLNLQKWPAGNVYRVGTLAGWTSIPTHQLVADLGVPQAGSHRYFRYYFQMAYGDDHGAPIEGNLEHGVETAPEISGSGAGMNFYRIPNNDGTWWPGYREISTGWRFVAPQLRLRKNSTYRLEWHLAYGATTYRVEVRIHDEDGVLVGTENDFYMILPQRNTATRMGGIDFAYTPSGHRYFRIGTNGPSSGYPMQNLRDENLYFHGAPAVCSTSWCGPVAP